MRTSIQIFGLMFMMLQFAVQVTIQLVTLACRAAAWLYLQVVVPGVQATAAGVMTLAARSADRREAGGAPRGWTAADERARRSLPESGDQ